MTYSIRVPYTNAVIRQLYRDAWVKAYLIPFGYWMIMPLFCFLFSASSQTHPWEGKAALVNGFLLGIVATFLFFLAHSFRENRKAMRDFIREHQGDILEISFSEQWVEMSSMTNKRSVRWNALFLTMGKQNWILRSGAGQIQIPRELISEELKAFILEQMTPLNSHLRNS